MGRRLRHFSRLWLALTEGQLAERQLVEIYDALAESYAEAGRFAESEREYRQALALVEKTQGRQSLDYALLVASMVALPTQSGHDEAMVTLLREAILTNRKAGSSRDLAVLRGSLALILKKEKRLEEEEQLLSDTLADLAKRKIADQTLVARTLNDLGVLRFDQGRYQESVELDRESIRTLENAVGSEHPSLIIPFNNLASNYAKMGRLEDASSAYQRAIDLCGKTLGANHLDYAVLLQNYAVVLHKLGRKHEARKIEAQGREIERSVGRQNGIGSTISINALSARGK